MRVLGGGPASRRPQQDEAGCCPPPPSLAHPGSELLKCFSKQLSQPLSCVSVTPEAVASRGSVPLAPCTLPRRQRRRLPTLKPQREGTGCAARAPRPAAQLPAQRRGLTSWAGLRGKDTVMRVTRPMGLLPSICDQEGRPTRSRCHAPNSSWWSGRHWTCGPDVPARGRFQLRLCCRASRLPRAWGPGAVRLGPRGSSGLVSPTLRDQKWQSAHAGSPLGGPAAPPTFVLPSPTAPGCFTVCGHL